MAAEDSKGLTVERLKQLIHYDKETGVFTRIAASKKVPLGVINNAPMSDGHTKLKVDNNYYLSHRLAWFYEYGFWPLNIDHINGLANDNRLANLRNVSHLTNMQNKRAPMKNNALGVMGVRFFKGRYRASIGHNKKVINLGRFDTPEEAHQAYLSAKRQLHAGCTI